MSSKPHTPATAKDLRTFGLTLGVACLVWAGILYWRGKPGASLWLLVIGISPRRVLDDGYRAFFGLVAGHIGSSITEAREIGRAHV